MHVKTYPLRTPRTRLSTKNDPMMIRLTKYSHGNPFPTESFIYNTKNIYIYGCISVVYFRETPMFMM